MTRQIREMMKSHGRLIVMGFLLIFFSAFGQSVFLGYYIPLIQEDLKLSNTLIGSFYAVATILSSIAIIFSGKGLDKIPLQQFIVIVFIGLAAGCFLLASAKTAITLFIAFFLLRQFGQGLMSLSSDTAINRYLSKNRGKAVALTKFGGAAHIMVFPILAVFVAHFLEWRTAWIAYGVFVLVILLPFFWFFMRHHQATTHAEWEDRVKAATEQAMEALERSWTRKHVLRDWRFYAFVSITIIPAFTGTAIFFYQRILAEQLELSALAFAGSFPFFTGTSIIFALVAGDVIDRFGEKSILIAYPLIYTIGLAALTQFGHIGFIYFGMALIGGGGGMMATTGGPLLARMYGTEHLGSIKSLTSSSMILASAISPFLFGALMDVGHNIVFLLSLIAVYTSLIWLLAFPIFKTIKQ